MQTKNLNVTPNGVMPRVNASQYDNGREVHFLLYDGTTPFIPPSGSMIRVEGAKSDGNGFSYECSYTDNNVTVIIREQMTVLAEDVECELRISKDSTDIGTINFILAVEKGALSSDVPISDTEIPAIIELAKDEQYNAEAWARGTRNGVPVSSDDPAYHNNSKWYAEHSQSGSFANLSDVDIDNPQDGQVPVYNSATEKWENQSAPSGGLLPHLYIDSEPQSVVTVVAPDSSVIVPTQISSGHWECDLPDYGVYTIHAVINGDDAVMTLTVDDVKEYHVTDAHYSYTLNVFAPVGSTIRVTDGASETYTGTGAGSTAIVFALHQASTSYTIQVTIDGITKSDSVTTPSTTGQSGSKTIQFGTINVTLDADFIGETITCVNGGITISKTASSTSLVFYPPTTGTWAISGEVSGTTYSVNAEVTSLSTPVSVSLETLQTVTVTLYSATEDTVTFTDASGVQKTEVFASGQSSKQITVDIEPSGSSITFTSGVAKNPNNLSNYYSKTVLITSNTTDVYLMPDNALYWWGYESDNLEDCSSANGWSLNGLTFENPTKSTNYIDLNSSANLKASGIGTKNAVSTSTINLIATGISDTNGTYGDTSANATKDITYRTPSFNLDSLNIKFYTASVSGSNYLATIGYTYSGKRESWIHAFWYE